ncbi:MAG: hypothetical protein CME88_06970 [Hirschia sp.]|nr:hypothetical protein [Hirschia sp.]
MARADSSQWPELFREAVTPAEFHTGFQFESIIEDEKFEEGETLHYVVRQQDEARTIELISLPAEMQEDREKVIKKLTEGEGQIWCDDYRDMIGGDVELVAEDDATSTYSFMINPDSIEDKTQRKIMKKTMMTLTINKADKWVTDFKYTLLEPVKPMVVAKVREFSLIGQCQRQENGRPHVSSIETRVSGSAMGDDFNQFQRQTVTNVALLD